MIVTRLRWLAALGVTLSMSIALHAQQSVVWRAAGAKATPAASTVPVVELGRPVALAPKRGPVFRGQAPDSVPAPEGGFARVPPPPRADPLLGDTYPVVPGAEAGFTTPISADDVPKVSDRSVGTAPPTASATPVLTPHRAESPPDDVPPPPASPFPAAGADIAPGLTTDHPVAPGFLERCRDMVTFGDKGSTHGRCAFQSDTCFPGMISPITMPFYFEDPRALTEIRPIFMYQSIPSSNSLTNGGDAIWFGTQLRLAVSDRLSFVVNELGFLSINPDDNPADYRGGTGFAELKLGPKYTFIRNTDTGTVAAFGVTFEIPCGNSNVYQSTGSLSIDPYVSFGQSANLGGGWGSLNFLGTTGYSFSVDAARAEFYYLNLHVDYNIAGLNTIFPLFEVNWMHYGNRPNATPFDFEGSYMNNFGAANRPTSDWVSLAGGLRFRFTEHVFAGIAGEFPITSEKGFADYRIITDVIFRF